MQNFDQPLNSNSGLLVADPGTLDLSLEFFTITPSSIKPFEEAVMAWKVVSLGPNPPVIRLMGNPVPAEGSVIVRPSSSASYVLTGKNRGKFVKLGTADLNFDSIDCTEGGFNDVERTLSRLFHLEFMNDPDIDLVDEYMNGQPTGQKNEPQVIVDESKISLEFKIKAKINNFPNPTIKAHFHFRFGVSGSRIEPYFMKQDVKVRFPLHTHLIPGSVIGLPIIGGQITDKVRSGVRNGLIQFAGFFLRASAGFRVLNVRTSAESKGSIITTVCPEVMGQLLAPTENPSIVGSKV
jgi:hypothetical protein